MTQRVQLLSLRERLTSRLATKRSLRLSRKAQFSKALFRALLTRVLLLQFSALESLSLLHSQVFQEAQSLTSFSRRR
jgi:hypothetical protein